LVFVFCQDDVFLVNIAFVYRFRTDGYRFIPVIARSENAPTLKTVIHPYDEPRQPGGCKLKTAPVRPVVAARPAEYVCSEDLFY
ncbi:hypothetical protein, partial [Salmonella enterica]|uniref:hypothetical protein n=1 Tax=Salmonella enterica TaxID=28901 RepID=UPI000C06825D